MSGILTVYSAWSREPIRELSYNTAEEADQYLAEAVRLWKVGALPKHERIDILERAAVLITERAEELALQIALEGASRTPMRISRHFVLLLRSSQLQRRLPTRQAVKFRWA